jgi:hypothetical protein
LRWFLEQDRVALAGAMARRRRCSSPAKEHRVLAADLNLYAALETKRIIEGEGGICEAASGDVSLAADVATIVNA